MTRVQAINRFMLLLCAPCIGIAIFLLLRPPVEAVVPQFVQPLAIEAPMIDTSRLNDRLIGINLDAAATQSTIERYYILYTQSAADASSMLRTGSAALTIPGQIYDRRITDKLGRASRHIASERLDLKLFPVTSDRYNGYALKAHLKGDGALDLTLGKDAIGGSETTLDAVRRKGAIAGVNAGGFADDSTGKRYPIGTTMLNGQYVYGFFPSENHLAFIGLNKGRKLIGGSFASRETLDSLKPQFGASFVPALLKDGKKLPIPDPWRTSPARAARTIVGSYKDDQLLFLVTDGNDGQGSYGATLEELQDKLLALGVRDAYNLDGGGSSTLIFDGEMINRPADGKLRPLATHFLFFR